MTVLTAIATCYLMVTILMLTTMMIMIVNSDNNDDNGIDSDSDMLLDGHHPDDDDEHLYEGCYLYDNAGRHNSRSFLAANSTHNHFLIARMLRFL